MHKASGWVTDSMTALSSIPSKRSGWVESAEYQRGAIFQLAGTGHLVNQDADARRRRVAIVLQVGREFFFRLLQVFADAVDDPQVGLMHQKKFDVVRRFAISLEQGIDIFDAGVHGQPEHLGNRE